MEKPFAEQPRTRSFSNDELRLLIAALIRAPKQIAAVWLMLFYKLLEMVKIQKASTKVLDAAGIEDGRHHDTRRVVQTNMAELGVAPHIADMVLNHAVKGAPRSRAHYDMYHYIAEKRRAHPVGAEAHGDPGP